MARHGAGRPQVDDGVFLTEADMVTAITMTYPDEAIGIVGAAQDAGMPAAISFTVETDGVLPDGSSLERAIALVDDATGGAPGYYMVNCAHPTHFDHVLGGCCGTDLRHVEQIAAAGTRPG
jgi:S-methylmethionine-dependent homocysteine/selenocysteine methylase